MSSIVIKGDTSGQIEIAAPAVAGSTTLTLPTGSGNILTDVSPKAGNVLQVVQSVKTDAFTTTSGSFVIPSGLSVNITPSSSANKILIMCYTNFAVSNDSGHSLLSDQTEISVESFNS